MRALSFLHALFRMISVGHLYSCEPVWTWKPEDGAEPTEESVACGRHEDPVERRPSDKLIWYEITCTPSGCWK